MVNGVNSANEAEGLNEETTMSSVSQQRHYRHHRGAHAHRGAEIDDISRRQSGPRQSKQAPLGSSDCLPLTPKDSASLKEDLIRILDRVKELESDKNKESVNSESLSQIAQEKLALASHALSTEPEDVDLMSKVVFVLFNQDLVKVTLNTTLF
ncbi:hypothetical protein BGX21_000858 [Mortierella sp. AD011]|nr:hypothetical protein BGX21_000858 [Mortierella sp. AD011]